MRPNVMTLSDRGRDLTFKITEMPALQAAEWCDRAVLVLGAGGLPVPEGAGISAFGEMLQTNGLAVIFEALAKCEYAKTKELLTELLECCSVVIGKYETRLTRETVNDHVKDFRTIYRLRWESLKANFGFFGQGAEGGSGSPAKAPGEPR